jgi:hypothetical protein
MTTITVPTDAPVAPPIRSKLAWAVTDGLCPQHRQSDRSAVLRVRTQLVPGRQKG